MNTTHMSIKGNLILFRGPQNMELWDLHKAYTAQSHMLSSTTFMQGGCPCPNDPSWPLATPLLAPMPRPHNATHPMHLAAVRPPCPPDGNVPATACTQRFAADVLTVQLHCRGGHSRSFDNCWGANAASCCCWGG